MTVSMCFGTARFIFFLLGAAARPDGADDGLVTCSVELELLRCFNAAAAGFIDDLHAINHWASVLSAQRLKCEHCRCLLRKSNGARVNKGEPWYYLLFGCIKPFRYYTQYHKVPVSCEVGRKG
jgi:hypothetical protein